MLSNGGRSRALSEELSLYFLLVAFDLRVVLILCLRFNGFELLATHLHPSW